MKLRSVLLLSSLLLAIGCDRPPSQAVECVDHDDTASCQAAGCLAYLCCDFRSCHEPGNKLPSCGADCHPKCETLNEASCIANRGCHRVYEGCAASESCEPVFAFCGLGHAAGCDASKVTCKALPPSCPPQYVPGIFPLCWEGCVKEEDC